VQVIIDGRTVRALRAGEETPEGVKLREIRDGYAVFETGGRAIALRMGQSTVAETVLRADSRGQFVTTAVINGVGFPAIIDTGASFVSIPAAHAQRLGVDYRRGAPGVSHTANGPVPVYRVTLASVQVGDVVLANVAATVHEGPLPITLIGMSFLKQVDMRRSGDTMMLSRPHLQ
jgi:aspartyl protease family protein